jgi:pimeloyl-ACP methyl ester carboxylesterase
MKNRPLLRGTTAIEIGIRHPELVRKLVVISAPYDRAGWYPKVYATVEQITPALFTGSGLPEAYAAVALNPDGWATLVALPPGGRLLFSDKPLYTRCGV